MTARQSLTAESWKIAAQKKPKWKKFAENHGFRKE